MLITDEEIAELDLPGRRVFEAQAIDGPIRLAQSFPNFAGAYFDQRAGGSLTILLTTIAGVDEIARLAPPGSRPMRVGLAEHTYADLKEAVSGIRDEWAHLYPGVALLNVALEVRDNGLRAEVEASQLDALDQQLTDLEDRLGVPVRLAAGVETVPAACTQPTDRHHCTYPIHDGSWVHSSTGVYCGLGFWVSSPSGDERFVTAGHCSGATAGSQEAWTHTGYGALGLDVPGLNWYYGDNFDVMIVYAPDSQAGNRIYAASPRVVSFGNPVVGSSVCASLSKRDLVDCGTVADDFVSYGMNGFTFFGGKYSGISIASGDSGSPVYHAFNSASASVLGLVSGGAYFALTTGVMQNNGYTVVNW
jgi:hypothetical protein